MFSKGACCCCVASPTAFAKAVSSNGLVMAASPQMSPKATSDAELMHELLEVYVMSAGKVLPKTRVLVVSLASKLPQSFTVLDTNWVSVDSSRRAPRRYDV